MSQLNKTQLEQENQQSFPNNNTGFITPLKLREFNTDMIDSMVDEGSYNADSASFSSSIDSLQDQINTLVVSGSGIFVQNEGTLLGIATDLDFVGDAVNATLMGSSAKISIQAVTTSSFNTFSSSVAGQLNSVSGITASFDAYTASNDAKVQALISVTGSYATTSSLNSVSSSLASRLTTDEGRIQSLENVTGSYASTSSLNNLSSSLASRVTVLDGEVNSLQDKTGSYATTGSNTFTGTQTLSPNNDIIFGSGGSIIMNSGSIIEVEEITGLNGDTLIIGTTGLNNGAQIKGSVGITGSLSITGDITASKLLVQIETASVIYSSGSNQFGDAADDTQLLFGSVIITGSLSVQSGSNLVGGLTASGLKYPSVDNGEKSFIQSDGSGNLTLQYVDAMYETVRNSEAITIAKGTPIYISGSTGANPNAFIADSGNPLRRPAVYIAGEDLTPSQTGLAIVLGLIEGVNTTGFIAGTEIFLKQGGGYTDVRPTGSALVQSLGVVTKEGVGGQGVILNPGPVNLPNIEEGYVWVGDSNSYPIAIPSGSLVFNGTSGTSGTSGVNGSNGTSGTSGVNGSNGTSGTSGVSGSSGTSGTSGIDGSNGTSGTSGVNGSNGTSGTSGVNGSNGTSGTSGVDGSNGTSGVNGSNGTSGTSGVNGSNGTSGTSGVDGSNGTSGTSGVNGSNGTSGVSGTNGSAGTSGLTPGFVFNAVANASAAGTISTNSGSLVISKTDARGADVSGILSLIATGNARGNIVATSGSVTFNYPITSPNLDQTVVWNLATSNTTQNLVPGNQYAIAFVVNGEDGSNGTSGTSGVNGTSGTSGVSGSNGTSGVSGSSGTSGTSGVDGSNGTSGTSGINGSNGTSGTSGVNGSNGTSGVNGSNGTSGTSGIDGTSGTSGVDGSNGTSGTSGVNGTSGTSGVNGSNGTSGTSISLTIADDGVAQGNAVVFLNFTGSGVSASYANNTGSVFISGGGSGVGFPFTGSAQITGSLGVTGSLSVSGSTINIQSGSLSGSFISNVTDTFASVSRVDYVVTLDSSSYGNLLASGSTNPNTMYIISGSNLSAGTNGSAGTSGVSGTSGTSGINGVNGTSGTSGIDGINGTSGTSGVSGTSGTSGVSGITFPYTGSAEITGSFGVTGSVSLLASTSSKWSLRPIAIGTTNTNLAGIANETGSTVAYGGNLYYGWYGTSTSGSFDVTGSQNLFLFSQGVSNANFNSGLRSRINGNRNIFLQTPPLVSGSNLTSITATNNISFTTFRNNNNLASGVVGFTPTAVLNLNGFTANTNSGSLTTTGVVTAGALDYTNNYSASAIINSSVIVGTSTAVNTANQSTAQTGLSLYGFSEGVYGGNTVTGHIPSGSVTNTGIRYSAVVGDNLVVTGSKNTTQTAIGGFGQYNLNDGIVNNIEQVKMFVGTGTSSARRTSFYVSASGVTVANDGLLSNSTFTASLREGYVWAGGAGNITTLVATSSFGTGGGGGSSFPFTGSAIISGSLVITGSAIGNVVSESVSSQTASLDFSAANFFTVVCSGSQFFNITNPTPGKTVNVLVTTVMNSPSPQPTASFSSNVKQVSGSRYIPTSGSSNLDILSFVSFDGTTTYLMAAQKFV